MAMFFGNDEINEGRQIKGYEYKTLSKRKSKYSRIDDDNNEEMTGTTSLGKGGVLDSVAQNHIEDLDLEKEKAILESKDIVSEYALYIPGEIAKALEQYSDKSKSRLMKRMAEDIANLHKEGIPSDKITDMVLGNYFGLSELVKYCDTQGPNMSLEQSMADVNSNQKLQKIVRTILKMRVNYVNRITSLMADMIKVNYKTLGLSEKQAEIYIDALKSGGNESVKAAGKVKDLIRQNADKFIVNDGKSVDLRSLGFGVILGGNKRLFEGESNEEVMMRFIQHAMRYDVVVVAHGSSRDDKKVQDVIPNLREMTDQLQRLLSKLDEEIFDETPYADDNKDIDNIEKSWRSRLRGINLGEDLIQKYYDKIKDLVLGNNDAETIFKFIKKCIDDESEVWYIKIKQSVSDYHNSRIKELEKDIEEHHDTFTFAYSFLANVKKIIENNKKYEKEIKTDMIAEIKMRLIEAIKIDIIPQLLKKRIKIGNEYWSCQPTRTLKAGPFTDVNELVRQLIKEGYKKILIEDCNPGHHKLAEDIMKTKGILINHSDFSNYTESTLLDSNDPSMLSINEIEQQIRSFAESYGIDYDDNEYLEECCNEYLDELYYVNESFSNNPLGEFFKKYLGAIIGFIKKIFNFFKLLMEKVKDLFYGVKAEKDIKVSIPEIKCPLIDIKEKKTVEITGKTREELKEKADKINEPISQEIKKINDNQKRDTNRIQQDIQRLERAANSNKVTANNIPTHKTESAFLEFEAGDGNDDQIQDDEENTSFTMDDGEKQNQTDDVSNTTTMVDNTKPTNTGSESNYGDSEDDTQSDDTQTDDTEYSMNGAEGDGEGNDESETGDEEYTVPDDNNGGDEEVPANLEDDGNTEETPDDGSTYSMSDGVDGSDSNSDDNTDTESGDGDDSEEGSDTESELNKLEKDLFDRLNDKQKEIKIKNLKENYAELHKRIEQLYDIIDKANPAEEAVISVFENTKSYLLDLSKIVFNYIDNTFDTKTYMENSLQYQKFLVALNQINGILDEFVDKKKK